MILQMYQAKRHFRSEFVPIRKLQYHVQIWGEPAPGKIPPSGATRAVGRAAGPDWYKQQAAKIAMVASIRDALKAAKK